MKQLQIILVIAGLLIFRTASAQVTDSTQIRIEYTSLEEALKNPTKVYRLNLSNQKVNVSDSVWRRFTNLEYLSLKNDHLKQIPKGIGFLTNLKTLDLSGNDFKIIPTSFSNLKNLQELYLNDEKNFKLSRNIENLSRIPNLKSLHLENDNLKELPANFYKLEKLEKLFLNDNHFNKVPVQIKGLKSLKYLDFHHNDYKPNPNQMKNNEFGPKIDF